MPAFDDTALRADISDNAEVDACAMALTLLLCLRSCCRYTRRTPTRAALPTMPASAFL